MSLQQSRISSLKTSFERNSSIEISPSQRSSKQVGRPPDADVPENFVSNNKKAWDNAIGDWVFSGIPHTPVSPSKPKMRPPSSEVRVPTPLSTPLGSTDNLLMDSESRYRNVKVGVRWTPVKNFCITHIRLLDNQHTGVKCTIHYWLITTVTLETCSFAACYIISHNLKQSLNNSYMYCALSQ